MWKSRQWQHMPLEMHVVSILCYAKRPKKSQPVKPSANPEKTCSNSPTFEIPTPEAQINLIATLISKSPVLNMLCK